MTNYQADLYDVFIPDEDIAIYESKEDLKLINAAIIFHMNHKERRWQQMRLEK